MKTILKFLFSTVILAVFLSCGSSQKTVKTPEPDQPQESRDTISPHKEEPVVHVEEEEVLEEVESPQPKDSTRPHAIREFRAAWVASVANINWPSKPGLSTAEQKKEAIELLDFLEKHHFNAIILQVRPQADALYKSELEPWSYFLTGKQGQAPEPYYDPLEFWIEAAHDRGLELHAWLNPYRAHHSTGGEIGDKSVIKTRPDLVVKLENGMYWMDPALEGTKKLSTDVVMDLVNRYDLDGIHFDDYFYPYDSYNGGKDFPDDKSWNVYKSSGGKLSRGDWRRENVNSFIQNLYKEIKKAKPGVKLGLSPFGIWRPGYPESIAGMDQYDKLYADARLWLNEGWIDYFTPQLYWRINQYPQSFPVLLGWWKSENLKNRHLWPGISVDQGGDEKNESETISQIMITRGMMPENPGVVHWSIAPLLKYPNLAEAVLEGPYAKRALVPESPWLQSEIPEAPLVETEKQNDQLKISWENGGEKEVFKWVVYLKTGNGWSNVILDRESNSLVIDKLKERNGADKIISVAVTAVSRTQTESEFKENKL